MNSNPDTSGFIRDREENSDTYHSYREIGINGYSRLGTICRFGKRFFVKSVIREFADDAMLRRMLRKEFDILLDLTHQGIVQAIDFINIPEVGDSIIMKWVEGVTLDKFMDTNPDKKLREKIALELIETVSWLHGKGIIHRDLKPSNIIIGNDHVKLIDFGFGDSSEYTAIKTPAGTEGWAAPEQLQKGYEAKPNCDVYSLGKVLKYIQPGLLYTQIIEKCISKNSEERYSDASLLLLSCKKLRNIKHIVNVTLLSLSLISILTILFIGYQNKYFTYPQSDIHTQNNKSKILQEETYRNHTERKDTVFLPEQSIKDYTTESGIQTNFNRRDSLITADQAIAYMKNESDRLFLKSCNDKRNEIKNDSSLFHNYQYDYYQLYSSVRNKFSDNMTAKELERFDLEVWDPVFMRWGAYLLLIHGPEKLDELEKILLSEIESKNLYGTDIQKYDAKRKLESLHLEYDKYKSGALSCRIDFD